MYFSTVLATPSDDGQQWPKHIKVNFHILLKNLLHLMDVTTYSRIKMRIYKIILVL
jgi:hypothetical protein